MNTTQMLSFQKSDYLILLNIPGGGVKATSTPGYIHDNK